MTRPASLQARLALWLGLTLTALWLAATIWTVQDIRHEMHEVFDASLRETAQRLLPLAVTEIVNREPGAGMQRLAPISAQAEFFSYLVRDADGVILMQSHGADPAMFPAWDGTGFRQNATHRFYNASALQGTIRLTVSEPLGERRELAREIAMRLGMPLVLVLPLTLIAVMTLVRLGLAGLRRFREGLAGRGARDLSPLPTEGLPTELRPVAATVNDLLARLAAAFEAERGFAANAAHELRTPLAGAIAQAQRLRAEATDPATADRAAEIEGTLKRLTATAERLMQLARAEGGRLRRDTLDDLRPMLELIVDDTARTTDPGRLALSLPDTPVLSDIDPDALAILARNLIENALRHGTDEAPVEITLDTRGRLVVANDSPVVPPDALAGLTDRFARAGGGEGSGLGLAIVTAIAERIGGRLTLSSPRPGRDTGFEAVVELPVAHPPPTPW
jgi:two-component system OmpR family sensor kinase